MFIWSDRGKEYVGAKFVEFLKENGISLYHTHTKVKATFAENFIRNLMVRISRYMTEKNTLTFYDKLPAFTNSYNNSVHSKIKRTPNSVNESNQMDIWREIYLKDYQNKSKGKAKFKKGDLIRISNEKLDFEKGYTERWTKEVFKIDEILPTDPITYKLVDLKGEELSGGLYAEELQLINDEETSDTTKLHD